MNKNKNAKKIKVLTERIAQLETEMKEALLKKSSNKAAYDVPGTMKKIAELRQDVKRLS